MSTFQKIDKVIQQHLSELTKPGVMAVRPGYRFAGGWITNQPCVVATVDQKNDNVRPQDRLPQKVGGVPVDVREASTLQKLRHRQPEVAGRFFGEEYEHPAFRYERKVASAAPAPATALATARSATAKPQIPYTAPKAPLNPVTAVMTVTCNVSPDAGWAVLSAFLTSIGKRLTVGMYDFTSRHVLQTVLTSLGAKGRELTLVLDHPSLNPSADQTDEQTRHDLAAKLKSDFQAAWALEGMDPMIEKWIFPSSYHIKVAVKDAASFWLSSGNWNNTNQPAIDPFKNPAAAAPIVRGSDRDWHIVVDHPGLSGVLEKYLQNDFQVATKWQKPGASAADDGITKQVAQGAAALGKGKVPVRYFQPLRLVKQKIQIQPLLSPDNYVDHILTLLQSAKDKLYIQMPYVHPPKAPQDPKFTQLIQAIKTKMDTGLDVRVIMSDYESQGDWLEQLKDIGWNMALVRIQANLHNKGFVVDSKVVALGSQNWSGDGVLRNRDATVILFHEPAARYYEQVFLHDWVNMAEQHMVSQTPHSTWRRPAKRGTAAAARG
jgi:phosphatidylserine/phosphatidylglycerophosphate/cardiolipin synthase-like enzyme